MMNGLSLSELCCLFCCPPCPSRIAAKLAFLPPEPTYTFIEDEGPKFTISLSERAEWQYTEREKESVEGFYARTSRGNRIACLFVRCSATARFTILFSHGNAVDLGQMSSFYLGLGSRINCNIFSYDYSGYGVSGGKPSEKNLYADIDAAWHALRTRYGISPENIILYGQSIGTVPTVDLAARYEVGAVVLHSPLMSGMRVAFPNTKRTWFFDAFPSIDKVPKVTSPVLVIHGTEDEVINFSHGLAIYERCPRAVEPLWVEGAGHNDVELYSQYLERLKQFISVELSPFTGEKAPVLPCDEESSFASTDDVCFFCEQQPALGQEAPRKESSKKVRSKDEDSSFEGNNAKKPLARQEVKGSKQKETIKADKQPEKSAQENTDVCQDHRSNHTGQASKKHTYLPRNLKNPFSHNQKNIVHRSLKNSFGQGQKKAESQITHTTLVDVQVEDCRQYTIAEKPVISFSNTSSAIKKDISDSKSTHGQHKADKKSPTTQFKYNCIEPALDSHYPRNNKQQCFCNKASIVEGITKGRKPDESDGRVVGTKSAEPTKKFLWGGKNNKLASKNPDKSNKEPTRNDQPEKLAKAKKACSPLKKLGRTSLTIEPDKIMLNLSKYSPCASRLAASSKILANDITPNLESPLHVARSRSPSHVDVQTESSSKLSERTSMQASLSLDIQQFQKSRYAPRSRSVGDSCVTSPTSEATTLSYSPTDTEILSLEEVGPQTSSAEGSASYSEVKEKADAQYADKVRRATLETKC
ncbi:hypothetical protein KM043_003671 [Ampulex compressa]|nr:hypothetical protein KM043_003671 [Ampulex compressa]